MTLSNPGPCLVHPFFSVVVLSHNSHLTKANSVLCCLLSIMRQNAGPFEIILVENSSDKSNLDLIIDFVAQHLPANVTFHVVENERPICKGAARNRGAATALSDWLLFMDDDTVLMGNHSLGWLVEYREDFDFGCGAHRFWTHDRWNEKEAENLKIALITDGDLSPFYNTPSRFYREGNDVSAEAVSFIGNFGLCRKEVFDAVGGFPLFPTSSCEDDYLILKLALADYRFLNLREISVLHIYHTITEDRLKEFHFYQAELIRLGYFEFDAVEFIRGEKPFLECLTELQSVHYTGYMTEGFRIYKSKLPLNLFGSDERTVNVWQAKNQLHIQDFARIIRGLIDAGNMHAYYRLIGSDFDNLAPVIEAALQAKIFAINMDGSIVDLRHFLHGYWASEIQTKQLSPVEELNQFPCDETSLFKRVEMLKSRYPYCEALSIALVGDDDMFSKLLVNETWVKLFVLEKDRRIVDAVTSLSERFTVKDVDLLSNDLEKVVESFPRCQTFLCDPPYTKAGVLQFVYAGLLLCYTQSNDPIEFYVIANQMMLGEYLFEINTLLAECNVDFYDRQNNFSYYPFPQHFPEKSRAESFLRLHNVTVDLPYSSTSDLFIYRTKNPDLAKLKSYLSPHLIYEHFEASP